MSANLGCDCFNIRKLEVLIWLLIHLKTYHKQDFDKIKEVVNQ